MLGRTESRTGAAGRLSCLSFLTAVRTLPGAALGAACGVSMVPRYPTTARHSSRAA